MNERLQQFLVAENISASEFADKIGVARAAVSHVTSGRNKPSFDFITGIINHFPALNIEWLLTGRGRMYKNDIRETTGNLFEENEEMEPVQVLPEPVVPSAPAEETVTPVEGAPKHIEKIIAFYSDNTFKVLE